MKHWINEGKEILKKWDYRKSQGRSPRQIENNYKMVEMTILSAFVIFMICMICKAIGLIS